MQYIDSHCHLSKNIPFADAFARAREANVFGIVLNSVIMDDWNKIIQITNTNKNVCGAIGIHPWHVDSVDANWDKKMLDLLRNNPYLFVGEIGLDKTRNNFAKQISVFVQALEMAIECRRIVNLHCVHAWDEVIKILNKYRPDLPRIVVHSFDGNQNAIDCGLDLYFSYSPNVANNRFKRMAASVERVPRDKILVESDSFNFIDVITATNGVLAHRNDVTSDDIFNNAKKVFFNG